ncbi:MAG: hypothetical protein K2G15_06765, partial [Muribaculaceae bacterium]|nr:hypothetical protein [Muribaculaceae bacterium]
MHPQKLHQHQEGTYQKGHGKERQKRLQHKPVKPFKLKHTRKVTHFYRKTKTFAHRPIAVLS